MFPLFELPSEAVELVLHSVKVLEEKRALRLVCKRTCAYLDRRVHVISIERPPWKMDEVQMSALATAPWNLKDLNLSLAHIGAIVASTMAPRRWPQQTGPRSKGCV